MPEASFALELVPVEAGAVSGARPPTLRVAPYRNATAREPARVDRLLRQAGRTPLRSASVGAGWYESSWDLRCGLDVSEEGGDEEALRAWIDDFVGARPGIEPAPRTTASVL